MLLRQAATLAHLAPSGSLECGKGASSWESKNPVRGANLACSGVSYDEGVEIRDLCDRGVSVTCLTCRGSLYLRVRV